MVNCSIRNCTASKNTKDGQPKLRAYRFPKDESIANQWLRYCKRHTNKINGRVCSAHFTPEDKFQSMRHRLMNESPVHVRDIKADAVPSLFLPKDSIVNTGSDEDRVSNEHCYASNEGITKKEKVCMAEIEIDVLDPLWTPELRNQDGAGSQSNQVHNGISGQSRINMSRENNIEIPLFVYKLLKKKVSTYEILHKNLKQIFTPGQIHSLSQPNMPRVNWSTEDIEAAVALRNVSPAAYDHLRATGVPLPSLATLRMWSAKCGVPLKEQEVDMPMGSGTEVE